MSDCKGNGQFSVTDDSRHLHSCSEEASHVRSHPMCYSSETSLQRIPAALCRPVSSTCCAHSKELDRACNKARDQSAVIVPQQVNNHDGTTMCSPNIPRAEPTLSYHNGAEHVRLKHYRLVDSQSVGLPRHGSIRKLRHFEVVDEPPRHPHKFYGIS